MRFSQWLQQEGLTDTQAKRRLGIRGQGSIARYKADPKEPNGKHGKRRVPEPAMMIAIYVESGGLVTPNDFYDLPELSAPQRAAA